MSESQSAMVALPFLSDLLLSTCLGAPGSLGHMHVSVRHHAEPQMLFTGTYRVLTFHWFMSCARPQSS